MNKKTGPIPVSTSSSETCPDACGLKKSGCYAKIGPLNAHWIKVTKGQRGVSFQQFLASIKALPRLQLWRHNQAGDLPGVNNRLNVKELKQLVEANKGKRGFTYTHKPLTKVNVEAIKHANQNGFAVNVSADTMTDADKAMDKGLPTVVVLPHDAPRGLKTEKGRTVAICPAQLSENVTCVHCQLCQKTDRNYVIGFRAHGVAFRKAGRLSSEDMARRALVKQAVMAAKKV